MAISEAAERRAELAHDLMGVLLELERFELDERAKSPQVGWDAANELFARALPMHEWYTNVCDAYMHDWWGFDNKKGNNK